MIQDMDAVRLWARRYYEMGLNVFPSSGRAKRPAMSGDQIRFYHRERIPESWLRAWWSTNIQIPLGVRWGYCVIDLDGEEGLTSWLDLVARKCPNPTRSLNCWVSAAPEIRDGQVCWDRSRHLWFRTPDLETFPTVHLTRGSSKHSGISVLGDGSLVIVPPSIHPDRKTSYSWLVGPDDLSQPCVLPSWLHLEIELVLLSRFADRLASRPSLSRPRPSGLILPATQGRRYERDDVLYALGDRKHEIAASYGLQVKKRPNSSGFYECRSIDREDARWSCTIDPRTGVYKDWATGEVLSFFSLLMRLDPVTFPKFPVTVNKLGAYALGGYPCQRLG